MGTEYLGSGLTNEGVDAFLDETYFDTFYPRLNGTGATGTWSISISGTAAAAPWSGITGKPTTLAGYAITDAAPLSHVGAGGTAHANAVAAGAAGFMTGADKSKLDGIASGADVSPTSFFLGTTSVALNRASGAQTIAGLSIGGNAATATVLETARTIAGVSFNGSANISIPFSGLSSIPTTRAGYGITDVPTVTGTGASGTWAISISGTAATASAVAWSGITSKPTTRAGYGITDVPTTTGTDASGTWSISITGNAATATLASLIGRASLTATSADTLFSSTTAGTNSFAEHSDITGGPASGWFFYENLRHANASNQWGRQIAHGWEGNANETYIRNVSGGTWTGWHRLLTSNNYNSYAPSLTGTGASGTWSIAVTGNAGSATVLQTARTIAGVSFNGSANISIPFANLSSIPTTRAGYGITDVPTVTGTGASGTWGISISGNAATATSATSATSATTASAAPWSGITGKPTTITGYGITDAFGVNAGSALVRLVTRAGTGTGNSGIANAAGGLGDLEILNNGVGASLICFHRSSSYASYFGLDTDNQWKVGGWSAGAVAHVLLHAGNYTSYSPSLTGSGASGTWGINITGNSATTTLATKSSTLSQSGGNGAAMTFFWSGQAGQPSWLWGSNDGTNIYVYNPSNFSVAYAATAGNASTVTNGLYTTSTTASVQFGSFGVGTAASGTTGEIRATNNVTAYYSDLRLKVNLGVIERARHKLRKLSGIRYHENELAEKFGYKDKSVKLGLIAQQVIAEFPEACDLAPFDTGYKDGVKYSLSGENYLTVRYESLIPPIIESVNDLSDEVDALKVENTILEARIEILEEMVMKLMEKIS